MFVQFSCKDSWRLLIWLVLIIITIHILNENFSWRSLSSSSNCRRSILPRTSYSLSAFDDFCSHHRFLSADYADGVSSPRVSSSGRSIVIIITTNCISNIIIKIIIRWSVVVITVPHNYQHHHWLHIWITIHCHHVWYYPWISKHIIMIISYNIIPP